MPKQAQQLISSIGQVRGRPRDRLYAGFAIYWHAISPRLAMRILENMLARTRRPEIAHYEPTQPDTGLNCCNHED
jgi:hypothetical protein